MHINRSCILKSIACYFISFPPIQVELACLCVPEIWEEADYPPASLCQKPHFIF